MRVTQQPAFVLHHRDYSETSLLLDIFTPGFGRVGLLAKGARRASSRNRGILKPFQSLLLSWSGKSDLAVLTGAEADGVAVPLEGTALYCGFYMNEVLMRLLHRHDSHEALYESYRTSLYRLQPDGTNEAVLRVFEAHLLRELGYGLVLDRDITDNTPLQAEVMYDYILERGPVRIARPELNQPTQGVPMRGASLLALAGENLTEASCLREAKGLMRALLAPHLGGKPLHSRKLFQRVAVKEII